MSGPEDRLHRGDGFLLDGDPELAEEQESSPQRQRASNAQIAALADSTRAQRRAGDYLQVGRASWYGADFAGKPMANGEPFDPEKMTCAHPTLPFGTELEVTVLDHRYNQERHPDGQMQMKKGLSAGAKVSVTVTDRGPYTGGRIVDLSEAAARSLGAIGAGVFMVGLKK